MANERSPTSDTFTHSFSPPDAQEAPKLAFGTYRVSGEAAARAVTRALEAGVRSIDTAHLYKNEGAVFGAVRAFEAAHPEAGPIRVSTKVWKDLLFDQTLRAVEISAERLGRALDVVLLHRPLPGAMWRALSACADRGLAKEIGVSNHSATRLTALLAFCDGLGVGRRAVAPRSIRSSSIPSSAPFSRCSGSAARRAFACRVTRCSRAASTSASRRSCAWRPRSGSRPPWCSCAGRSSSAPRSCFIPRARTTSGRWCARRRRRRPCSARATWPRSTAITRGRRGASSPSRSPRRGATTSSAMSSIRRATWRSSPSAWTRTAARWTSGSRCRAPR